MPTIMTPAVLRASVVTFLVLLGFAKQTAADPGDTEKIAHAALGSAAWVVIFPLGAILMRVVQGPRAWIVHAAVQVLGTAMVTAGAANGIYLAQVEDELDEYHPIIGLVLFALVWLQAAGGLLSHVLYAKSKRRNAVGYVHKSLGLALITLGMINGGLGLLLAADASKGAYIAYGVIAAVIWLALVANAIMFEIKGKSSDRAEKSEMSDAR